MAAWNTIRTGTMDTKYTYICFWIHFLICDLKNDWCLSFSFIHGVLSGCSSLAPSVHHPSLILPVTYQSPSFLLPLPHLALPVFHPPPLFVPSFIYQSLSHLSLALLCPGPDAGSWSEILTIPALPSTKTSLGWRWQGDSLSNSWLNSHSLWTSVIRWSPTTLLTVYLHRSCAVEFKVPWRDWFQAVG